MDDTSKSKNEETPKPPVEDVKEETAEEPQPEETSEKQTEGKSDNEEEKPSEQVEKTDKEEKPADEQKTEEPPKEEVGEAEKTKEQPEQPAESPKDDATEETKGEEKPEQPVESKAKKDEGKAETKKKHEDDFKYIVRLANTDIDGEKAVAQGLTTIKGVGAHMSVLIINETGIDRSTKMGNLTDAQIEKIRIALDNITKNAPVWMLNRRKDYDTGKDIHLIGPEIDMRLRDEINIMKKIRSYRGIRHERGLCVRGQRTRANNRRGLALGVSKKRVLDKK